MPPPKIFPCGGPGQPACPAQPAAITEADIEEAFYALHPELAPSSDEAQEKEE